MLLEQECKDSGDLVDTVRYIILILLLFVIFNLKEKQKLLRAVEQKGMIEMKMEALHERYRMEKEKMYLIML